jgi:TetR/AcrR family transcriptional regulator
MSEIAAEAGLGPSSLYYWFGSKQEILELMITDVNRAPLELARRLMAEPGRPATRLYRLIRADVVTLCSLPFDINEVHRLAGEDEHAFGRYWEERQLLNDAVEALISQGVEAGDLLPVEPRLAALTVLANDEAVQNWWRPVAGRRLAERPDPDGGDYRTEEIATFMADLTVRGLLTDARELDAVRAAA